MATFGNTSDTFLSNLSASEGRVHSTGVQTYSPATSGLAQSITAWLTSTGSARAKFALYNGTALLAQTAEVTITTSGWYTANLTAPLTVSTGINYALAMILTRDSGSAAFRYNKNGVGANGYREESTYPIFTNPASWTIMGLGNIEFLIYCTYTPPPRIAGYLWIEGTGGLGGYLWIEGAGGSGGHLWIE